VSETLDVRISCGKNVMCGSLPYGFRVSMIYSKPKEKEESMAQKPHLTKSVLSKPDIKYQYEPSKKKKKKRRKGKWRTPGKKAKTS